MIDPIYETKQRHKHCVETEQKLRDELKQLCHKLTQRGERTMTPEDAKELLSIIQAFANGEEIECRAIHTDKWRDYKDPLWVDEFEYRIKPKKGTDYHDT